MSCSTSIVVKYVGLGYVNTRTQELSIPWGKAEIWFNQMVWF